MDGQDLSDAFQGTSKHSKSKIEPILYDQYGTKRGGWGSIITLINIVQVQTSSLNEIYVGYDTTSKDSKVYILQSLQNICVCQDVKFDQDARYPKPQGSPIDIDKVEKLAAPNIDPQIPNKSNTNSQILAQVQILFFLIVQSKDPYRLHKYYKRHKRK